MAISRAQLASEHLKGVAGQIRVHELHTSYEFAPPLQLPNLA